MNDGGGVNEKYTITDLHKELAELEYSDHIAYLPSGRALDLRTVDSIYVGTSSRSSNYVVYLYTAGSTVQSDYPTPELVKALYRRWSNSKKLESELNLK